MRTDVCSLHRWAVRFAVCFLGLLTTGGAGAQPLEISVSNAQYTTYVEAPDYANTNDVSRTTTSSFPISDELVFPADIPDITNYSIANAGLFSVSDHTGFGFGNASATSQLWFFPLADQTQTIGIQISDDDFHGGGNWTGGSIGLLDVTSSSELWNYSWVIGDRGNIPWDPYFPYLTANFGVDTDFHSSHQYELTMMSYSNAGDDQQTVSIQLTGLQVVPEPSTAGLLVLMMVGVSVVRRLPSTSGQSRLL